MSADTLTGADNEAFLAELARRAPAFSGAEMAQASAALAQTTRPQLKGALAGAADAGGAVAPESAPEDPRLASFLTHYDRWSAADKAKCSWPEVKARLLGNGSEDLKRAEAMPEGVILFGVDEQGNPLIANGGPGPVLTDMNYADTRKAVRLTEEDGKQVPTGYEMLSAEAEIRAYEAFTGRPVVQPVEGKEWAGIWRESGDNPDGWARRARVGAGGTRADLYGDHPGYRDPGLGVRCLLRVLKKS